MSSSSGNKHAFGPVYVVALFVLAILSLCSGCEKEQQLKVGDDAPEISTRDIHGEPVALDRFKGKIVVIFFWANSCCGDKVKLLEPFYRRFREKGVAVMAVNAGDAKSIVESYSKSHGLTFPMLTDEDAMISKQYGVFGFPTIFILDKNGIIRQKILGDILIEQLQKLVVRQFDIQREIEANFEKMHPR